MPRPSSFRAALAGLLAARARHVRQLARSAPRRQPAPAEDGRPARSVAHRHDHPGAARAAATSRSPAPSPTSATSTFTRHQPARLLLARPRSSTRARSPSPPPSTRTRTSVGERVTVPGTFDTVDELAPGETRPFADSVPRRAARDPRRAEGVYWIGIHALGDSAGAARRVRRRPGPHLHPRASRPATPSQEASVILPIRDRVWFDRRGHGRRHRALGAPARGGRQPRRRARHGRLGRRPRRTAGWSTRPCSSRCARLAPRQPAAQPRARPRRCPARSPARPRRPADGATTATPEPTTRVARRRRSPPRSRPRRSRPLAEAAQAWLDRFRALVGATPVLTLPFGDLDVSAAVRNEPRRATTRRSPAAPR